MLAGTLLLATALADQPSIDPGPYHPAVANLVASLLDYQHYEPQRFDDALSSRWLDGYLDALDFNHMIFLASDVEEFSRYRDTMDDDVLRRKPSLEAATAVYTRYQERFQERVESVLLVLDGPGAIEVEGEDTWTIDRSESPWPTTAAEADALWALRVTEQVILGDLQERPREDTLELLRKRYQRLAREVATSESADVLEIYLTALAESFDPHSAWFKPATSDNFDIELANAVEGIGAQLRTENEYTVVVGLVPGGPAELGGELQVGDKIISVAQEGERAEDIVDLRLDKVVKMIRGAKGTDVTLTVLPAGGAPGETREIVITRDRVVLAESDADATVIEVGEGEAALKIGVLEVPSFYLDIAGKMSGDPDYRSASRDTRRLLGELTQQGVDAVILDLRQNGGGSLGEAVALSGLFIDEGPIVQVRDREGNIEVLGDPDPATIYAGPLAVLTSALSASASEIVAGAIQDYGRGLVIGADTTHGKGTVQTVVGLDELLGRVHRGAPASGAGGALKLTIQKFYRVSGASTQNRGVRSDVVLPSRWDGLDIYESDLDGALPYDEIAPARFKPVGDPDAALDAARAASAARVAASDDFRDLAEALAERDTLNQRTEIALNFSQRKAELEARLDDPSEPEVGAEGAADTAAVEAEEEPLDFVLEEAAAVLADWVAASG